LAGIRAIWDAVVSKTAATVQKAQFCSAYLPFASFTQDIDLPLFATLGIRLVQVSDPREHPSGIRRGERDPDSQHIFCAAVHPVNNPVA
jgi:hypothetical protein